MFENIGGKIKGLATITTVIGIVLSVIVGIAFFSKTPLLGIMIAIVGIAISWIGSFMTYGLGQLIENSDITVELLNGIYYSQNPEDSGNSGESLTPEQAAELERVRVWRSKGLITQKEYEDRVSKLTGQDN